MTLAPTRLEYERRPALSTPRPILVTRLQSSATTIATARADADFRIDSLFAVTSTGSGDTLTLHVIPDGGSASTANLALQALAVAANTHKIIFTREYPLLLAPGYSLVGLCGTSNAVHVYGMGMDYRGEYGL